jgi:alpha-1,6-mannosyltransferase
MRDGHLSNQWQRVLGCILLCGGILFIAYGIDRNQFVPLWVSWAIAFGGLLLLQRSWSSHWRLTHVLTYSLLIRLALLPATPNLSEDVYRFIWDGYLLHAGANPFLMTPREWMATIPDGQSGWANLFSLLNSPDYYSVYPPVKQALFYASTVFSQPGDTLLPILIIRLILIAGEGATLLLGWRLLQVLQYPVSRIGWYAINPLVIIELTGNLHFEGLVLLSLFFAMWQVMRPGHQSLKYTLSISGLVAGIGTKLTPLMLIPAMFFKMNRATRLFSSVIFLILFGIIMSPLAYSMAGRGFLQSLDLYFRVFEFNASFYYIVRWLTTTYVGYNMIAYTGPFLSVVGALVILALSWKRRRLDKSTWMDTGMWIYATWLWSSTTVHPWYIIVPLGLSIFGRYTYVRVWSFTVFLSYHAYRTTIPQEDALLLATAYIPVFVWMLSEVWHRKRGIS